MPDATLFEAGLVDAVEFVARDAGEQHRARVEHIRIEEVRHEDSAAALGDELIDRLRAMHHAHAVGLDLQRRE